MATKKPKTVPYRRKRERKTDYNKRLKILLSRKPRLVVRITNKKIISQLAEFSQNGDRLLVSVDSYALKKLGWKYSCKNMPAAYLTGLMIGKKALDKGINEAILDTGLLSPLKKSKTFAFLKGVIDSGLNIPHGGEDIFPGEERISGKHIQDYAVKIKGENKQLYDKLFAQYLKNNVLAEDLVNSFTDLKAKLSA